MTEKIRVLQVTSRLNVGGVARLVLDICDHLNKDRFECRLVTGQVSGHEEDILSLRPTPSVTVIKIAELGRNPSLFKDVAAFVKLNSIIRDFKPHIVNTHAAKAGTLGRLAATLNQVPVRVHSFHGNVFSGYFSFSISKAIVIAERLMGKLTHSIIVLSKQQKQDLVERYHIAPEERVQILPSGIAVEAFESLPSKTRARELLGLPLQAKIIGSIGRMTPIKNQELLLDAFAALSRDDRFKPLYLLLVGDGESRPIIEKKIAALTNGNCVKVVGWLNDLAAVYAAIDVLALTSKNEGLPLAVMEAMAAGVPVVSTPVGGVVDLIHNGVTGLISQSYKAEDFAAALQELLLDSRRSKCLAGAARDYVRQHHNRRHYIASLERLYEELVKKARAPSF